MTDQGQERVTVLWAYVCRHGGADTVVTYDTGVVERYCASCAFLVECTEGHPAQPPREVRA